MLGQRARSMGRQLGAWSGAMVATLFLLALAALLVRQRDMTPESHTPGVVLTPVVSSAVDSDPASSEAQPAELGASAPPEFNVPEPAESSGPTAPVSPPELQVDLNTPVKTMEEDRPALPDLPAVPDAPPAPRPPVPLKSRQVPERSKPKPAVKPAPQDTAQPQPKTAPQVPVKKDNPAAEKKAPAPPKTKAVPPASATGRNPDGSGRKTARQGVSNRASSGAKNAPKKKTDGGTKAAAPSGTPADIRPKAVSAPRPAYPRTARKRGIEGWVRVRFLVDASGRVRQPSVIQANPAGVFEGAVLKALSQWRFRPGTQGGKPADAWVETTIKFRLVDG